MFRAKLIINGVYYYGMWGTLDQATCSAEQARAAGLHAIVEEA